MLTVNFIQNFLKTVQDQQISEENYELINKITQRPLIAIDFDYKNVRKIEIKKPITNRRRQVQQQSDEFRRTVIDVEEAIKQQQIRNMKDYVVHSQSSKDDSEKVIGELKYQLNILSPDNYEKVIEQVESELKLVVSQNVVAQASEVLINKALGDQKYIQVYAKVFDTVFQKYPQIKRYIRKDLQNLFNQQKPLIKKPESYKTLENSEKNRYSEKRKEKYLKLGKFLATLYIQGIFPIAGFQNLLQQTIQNYISQYDLYLYKKSRDEELDLENDFHHADYIDMLIQLLEFGGSTFDKTYKENLNDPEFKEQIKEENKDVQMLKEKLLMAEQSFENSELDEIVIPKYSCGGIFSLLQILYDNQFVEKRQRILIKNIIERRIQGWQVRQIVKNSTATTKQEVFQGQLSQEELQKKRRQEMMDRIRNLQLGNTDDEEDDDDEDDDEDEENESFEGIRLERDD